MSAELLIVLQGGLAFGAPLALAVIELWQLRRSRVHPCGGGELRLIEPQSLMLGPDRRLLSEPANSASVERRVA